MPISRFLSKRAFTLVETMVIVAIISFAFLGVVKGFMEVSRGLLGSRQKNAANNIIHDAVQTLKENEYEELYVTSQSDLDEYGYDKTYFPPETHEIDGVEYTKYTLVSKVRTSGSDVTVMPPSDPDEGLKKVTVTIEWTDMLGKAQSIEINNIVENPNRTQLLGNITGTVRKLSDSGAIQGANVYVLENQNWRSDTDASGEFTIAVATGTWNLDVVKTGYYDLYNGSYTVEADVVTTVPLGDLDMTALQTGSVDGVVVSTGGSPVASATVSVTDESSVQVVTAADGSFTVASVSTGVWTVSASSGIPFNMYGSTENIAVNSGVITTVEVVLSTPNTYGSISGVVNKTDTGNHSGIMVEAGASSDLTNTVGAYTITNVEAGSMTVRINPDAFDSSYTSDDIIVSVYAGQNTAVAGTVKIWPAGSVSGSVLTPGADPYPGIVVTIIDNGGTYSGSALSAADGSYQIDQLRENGNPYKVYPILDTDSSSTPASINVTVSKGGNDFGNDFEVVSAWGEISGTVKDSSGNIIETGVVILCSSDTISIPPPDMASGEYGVFGGMSLSDGTYSIRVQTGYQYNVYAYYTELSGSSPETSTESDTGVTLSGSPTPSAEVNFTFP
jgi:type II secretory pathway pseudopilin PulG